MPIWHRNAPRLGLIRALFLVATSHSSPIELEPSRYSGLHNHCRMLAFCGIPRVKQTGNRLAIFSEIPSGSVSPPSIPNLLRRAQKLRDSMFGDEMVPPFDSPCLTYPSSVYNMKIDDGILNGKTTVQRGFCNWLIPQRIMIGQYPGTTPEKNGPSSKECQMHIRNMVVDVRISLFCCLQTEVPPQEDETGWKDGGVYLQPESARREFPRPFTRYGPPAQSFTDSQLAFFHAPIEDLNVPTCNNTLLSLLSRLLEHFESEDNRTIYLHCWGGRGRAGLIGSCLASLLFPELSSEEVLDWVQRAYDTRPGAQSMPKGLQRSPQTEQQRRFVREFVNLVRKESAGSAK